ncbi:MAG: four helix bundle protein [Prevotella sp.]|nr:four helix bundle protein [Prevotella sp.]
MAKSVLAEKSLQFAIRVVNCVKYLQGERKEYVMSKQMLRSGTSIGANIHEAIYAQSKADFSSKLSISLKEASETSYWLTILKETEYLSVEAYHSMKTDVDEIIRIIIASLKTTRKE